MKEHSGLLQESTSGDASNRPEMKPAEGRPKNTWFWLGLAAIAGIVFTALWALRLQQKSCAALRHTEELIVTTNEILASSSKAGNGAFEYIITREARYLKAYDDSRKALDGETGRLRRLVRDDPAERAETDKLRSLLDLEIQNLSEITKASDGGGLGPAGSRRLTARTEQIMSDARQVLAQIKTDEESALERFSKNCQSRMRAGLSGLAGSALLALCGLILAKIAMSRNVFRRRRAERVLDLSERRFQALCQQAPLGIYETDERGRWLYGNPRWSEISGLTSAESLGNGWNKALHPDDRKFEGWEKPIWKGSRREFRLLTPAGETRWIRTVGGPIHSDTGEVTGYVGMVADCTEYKQAETELRERDALRRAILNSLPADIAVMKSDGTIEAANESWLRAVQSRSESSACWVETGGNFLKKCKEAALAGSEDARKLLAGIQDVLAGRLGSFEMDRPCELPHGRRWYYISVTPLVGVSAGGAVIAQVDITDRKRMQDWFRLAVEAAPSGMIMTDSDGRILLVNSRAENLFGYRREELKGQPVEMLVPELLRERHRNARRDFYKHPHVRVLGREQDLYARRKDGTQFPAEIGLNPIETDAGIVVLSSIMDMTDKRRAEDERQKFVSLAERSLEFIGMYDLNFKPFYINSAGLHLVGVDSLEEARRFTFQDHFFPEDQPFIVNEFLPRLQREGYGKVQIRFRHFKTSEPVWVIYNMFAIYDARSAHVGWGTVSVDITERKRAEEALRESRQELRALAGRLIIAEEQERKRISRELHDDLGQKLALLAFDASGLLVNPPPSAERVHEQLFRLRGRIVELAQDVRQISHQLHPPILEDLGLFAALRELCEEFSQREGIEVLFTQEGTAEGLPIEVGSCLYRVTQEALHNVQKHARTGYVRVKVNSSAHGIHLVVRDTGVGFDAEANLRRPGLGIVSMKERVRMVQGEFSIDSRPGHGTEVRVFVPLSKAAS